MTMGEKLYSVAEICDGKIKLISDDGKAVYLDRKLFPKKISEGDMLRIAPLEKNVRSTEQRRQAIIDKHKRILNKR